MKYKTQNTKLLFLFFLIFLFIFFLLLFNQKKYLNDYKKIKINIKNKTYTLFIADTEDKRRKGLSNIASIKNDEGMLFIFEQPDYYSFWMKDMKFPLDFIFLNDNKIVDLLSNIDPSTYPQTFTSKSPADKVIELKSGEIKTLKLKQRGIIKFIK